MQRNILYHTGIKGMQWGHRRYQYEDGSLTPEGKLRYGKSLSNTYGDNDDYDGDYSLSKGSSVFRRTQSNNDSDFSNSKYTYAYEYDNDNDDAFYKQFGKKVTEYSLSDNAVIAGKKAIGKAFVDKMLNLTDENDIDAMDAYYYEARNRLGKDYVEDLFTLPYEPGKHMDALEKAGADMVARLLSAQRNDKNDEKMKRRGLRNLETAANDIGLSIVDKLLSDGYSGIRDYNDYGSAAGVNTPTILFDPDKKLKKAISWIDD